MKQLLTLFILVIFSTSANSQAFGKLFRQAETQRKYLLQQIAALHVYIGHAKKGYSIAREGLNAIGDIKRGDLNLHKDYFNSLKNVNPQIKHYSKVADIITLQLNLLKEYINASKQLEQSRAIDEDEVIYAKGVFNRLIEDCNKTIEALIAVTTSNQFEMTDDERLKRIDGLYGDMQGKYTFVHAFAEEAKLLVGLRKKEHSDIQVSRMINGVKN